ncbi:MAG TPA: ABC transporter ATP-binding protein [Balneolales bacterium]|nr:ABC transporter ATP-binding protein [Balneolales bacterium]
MKQSLAKKGKNDTKRMSNDVFIELHNVVKTYTEGETLRQVVNGIDLTVQKGEIIVLLGRSGSGKSTILNLLGGMDIPDRGTITINDRSINEMSENERTLFRRKHLGFVFQFFNLIPTLTVEENLLLPLELNGKLTEESLEKVRELLRKVDMEDRLDSYPDKLSGGEQQRIAIARALVHNPMLIIADEPTGNLDVHTSEKVISLLHDLTKEKTKTLIMATHSREIAKLADRIFVLREGQLHPEKLEELL